VIWQIASWWYQDAPSGKRAANGRVMAAKKGEENNLNEAG
jgi:hypothetical protein